MPQQETKVWREILLSLTQCRLFRNQRYKGPIVRKGQITKAWADCGLTDGAGDLIGYTPIMVTPLMVGQTIAVFTSIEAKTATGPVSEEQERFIAAIIKAGGIAGVVRSVDEARELINNWKPKNNH